MAAARRDHSRLRNSSATTSQHQGKNGAAPTVPPSRRRHTPYPVSKAGSLGWMRDAAATRWIRLQPRQWTVSIPSKAGSLGWMRDAAAS